LFGGGDPMNTQDFKRKLTAVFSADVAGYSRLMGEDEAATVKTLETYKQVMFTLIKQHRGRVIDSPGDNLLAEFASVVDAVQCGVAVQKELQARNAQLPENKRMQFRIGINLGDVIEEQDRIYGDGVNIAARLESCADPGGICVSKTAFDHIETKLPLGYEYLGEKEVKNIAKPVGAYRVLMEPRVTVAGAKEKKPSIPLWRRKGVLVGAVAVLIVILGVAVWNFYWRAPKIEPASKEKMAFPLPDKPSMAVLAFTNMSGNPKDDLLGDGIAEGIINALSRSERLFVIARNSSFTYKGKPVKVKQVSEEMGVRYVIEGSIQREGERVRITVQLIDALTGHHLFSERYDRDLKDILSLQDEITMKVMTAVQVKLTVGEGARIRGKGTKNLDAYLKVLEAGELKATIQNKGRVERSMQLCEEAIALDPEYALAYSTLSTGHAQLVILGASDSPRESLRRAVELGKKAVALDESSSFAHANLAFPYQFLGELDKAIEEAEKAVSLGPNSAAGYFALGSALYSAGRPKEAIPIFQKCLRLSPVPVHSNVLFGLANSYVAIGQYEEAIATYRRTLQIFGPDHLYSHVGLASTYMEMGREKEARAEGAEVLRIDPKFSLERYVKNRPIDPAAKDRLAERLRKAGLK
jgi:adenylate cyclase